MKKEICFAFIFFIILQSIAIASDLSNNYPGSVLLPGPSGPKINNLQITGTDSGVETLNNKTIVSPIIIGNPSGSGLPIIIQKGGVTSNYTGLTSTVFSSIDSTLNYTVTVPINWKLTITASFQGVLSATGGSAYFEINRDTTQVADGEFNDGLIWKTVILQYLFTGDGSSHAFSLQYSISGSVSLGVYYVTIIYRLEPAN
ncbi:MAG: hypothetical protein M0Z48_04460 [Nitrospiraceae bacterium]|nr:hypothetical protein [Nitrospiraceae bacterium]